MSAERFLSRCKSLLDPCLDDFLPSDEQEPKVLHRAMRHLVFPGGKRLRPAFSFAIAECLGASAEKVWPAAGAAELIHSYSLIHDDLPCMDDDDERRGIPTVHVAFGEATAVLAGDALLAEAFRLLSSNPTGVASQQVLDACGELALAAGPANLVGGQYDDVACSDRLPSAGAIESIHLRKSAALIRASMLATSHLVGVSPSILQAVGRFGECVGVAFQIADDLLDADSDRDGCSLVRVMGPRAAKARAQALLDEGLAVLTEAEFGEAAENLCNLTHYVIGRQE